MNGNLFLMIATSLLIAGGSASAADNPFFGRSALPYELPPFDRIQNEHYGPAFDAGMKQQRTEVDEIANSKEPPSFENTLVALERSGQLLKRVSSVFFNLTGANTNDAMEAVERSIAPQLAAHRDAILLNERLFQRVDTLYARRDELGLDAESKRLLERYYTDFVRAGARLSAADKEKLRAFNAQLAVLSTTFSQNVLKETNASAIVVDSRAELDGLSDNAIQGAADAAKARGLEGKYVLTLMNTTGQPQEDRLSTRSVRQRLQQASLARGSRGGEFDNRAIVLKIARLRAERAQLLGYASHAAYALEDETARTADAVNRLLADLAPPAQANARKEAADMQMIIDAEQGGFPLAAHDWAFYSEKLRQARYNFDEAQLKPYFEISSVLQNGAFFAANQLFGISFKERHDLPVYQPDVRAFEVLDTNGKPLALFLFDAYARSNKRGGAWMNAYVEQSGLLGKLPVIGNHLNVPKPPPGEPTLLTFTEVTTLFHEFGHALHGMLSNVRYPRFSGTHVPRDFVEYPSQVNEMWAVWPEVLKNYAKHYQSGAPMPLALVDKVMAARKFNQGFATSEYLAAALLDQHWHQLTPTQIPTDALAFESAALQKAGVDFAPVPPRYRSTYFSHIFSSGYSAGYYAYLWAEVLDADSVEWFKQNGGMTRSNGDRFRQNVLSRGGSADAMTLFRNFSGREPKIEALLERRGLKSAQDAR